MVTSQTFISYKLVTADRIQDPFVIADFGTTAQGSPVDSQEIFTLKIRENPEDNTITYLVVLLEGVIIGGA